MQVKDEPLAFHLIGTEVRGIPSSRGKGPYLPPTLVIPPGSFRIHGKTYSLRAEGLYRFFMPAVGNEQRIVFEKDPFALLSAIAWLTSHGSRDDPKSPDEWLAIAMKEKLIITCGNVTGLGVRILSEHGIPARRAEGVALEKLNTYDSGHVLLEARMDGRWTLADLDAKTMFRRGGRRLSLMEFGEASQTGDYELERISAAAGVAVAAFVENGYDYGLFMETCFCAEEWVRRWYRRIMMVPILDDETGQYGLIRGPAEARKVARLHGGREIRCIEREEFERRFYGE